MMLLGYLLLLLWSGTAIIDGNSIINDTEALLFNVDSPPISTLYLRILHVEEDYVLVGARATLYNVSTITMTLNAEHKWTPFEPEILYCQGDGERFGSDCNSYVRSAVKKTNSLFHICASSSKKPQCREFKLQDGSWTLTNNIVKNELVDSLAPLLPWNEIITLKTSDTNTIYVASHILKSGSVWQPYFFRGNSRSLSGDLIPGLKTDFSEQLFKIDYYTERATEFTSMFETEDYVFLTYTEPALESIYSVGFESATYSRIARVCKNDRGRGRDADNALAQFLFATLFKTRLMCGNSGVTLSKASGKYLEKKFSGYYGSYVNEIADSSVPHVSSITGADGEEIILAIFNSPSNSARTSAICAYKVSDLNRVFDTSDQIEFDSHLVPREKKTRRPAARCYADSTNQTSESRDSLKNYLLSTPVFPINNHSLFLSGVDYRMTRMVVDWQVKAVDGKMYDIIYVSTDDGRLIKLVKFTKVYESEERYHVVEERTIFPGKAIQEMKLIHDEWGKKHILVNSLEQMKRVALEKCHFKTSCSECISLRDPYCSWSPSVDKCVSTTHEVNDKYQNMSSGHSAICDVTNNDGLNQVTVELTAAPDETTTKILKATFGASNDNAGSDDKNNSGTNNTVLIILVVVIPVICAIAAFAAGYMYGRRKFMSPTPHIDHELTNKCKGDTLKSNSDAYQEFPKLSNLQMMNNFNGKSPNVDTTSVGERTLNRQKQVYV